MGRLIRGGLIDQDTRHQGYLIQVDKRSASTSITTSVLIALRWHAQVANQQTITDNASGNSLKW